MLGTGYFADDAFLSTGQFGNETLLTNALRILTDMEIGTSIPSRNVSQEYLTVTSSQAVFWGMYKTRC